MQNVHFPAIFLTIMRQRKPISRSTIDIDYTSGEICIEDKKRRSCTTKIMANDLLDYFSIFLHLILLSHYHQEPHCCCKEGVISSWRCFLMLFSLSHSLTHACLLIFCVCRMYIVVNFFCCWTIYSHENILSLFILIIIANTKTVWYKDSEEEESTGSVTSTYVWMYNPPVYSLVFSICRHLVSYITKWEYVALVSFVRFLDILSVYPLHGRFAQLWHKRDKETAATKCTQ